MSKDTKTPAPITDDERRKRQKAVDFARASVGLEGFKLSPECDALCHFQKVTARNIKSRLHSLF